MEFVIDIQCLKDANDEVIPKEVAVLALDNEYIAHWIIAPPCNAHKLPEQARKQNIWLSRNHHCLDWNDGEIARKTLYKNLQEISKHACKVYVRGREKTNILKNAMSCEIINLEDNEKAPSFSNLPWQSQYCLFHALKQSYLTYACALNNASRLKVWLKTNKQENPSDFAFFSDLLQLEQNEFIANFNPSETDKQITYSGCVPSRSDSSEMA